MGPVRQNPMNHKWLRLTANQFDTCRSKSQA